MMRLLLVAVVTFLLPNEVAYSHLVSCHLEHEYSCGTQCIPLEFLCDNVRDCHNGQDEESCEYLRNCPIGDFMCRTGECVSSHFKCNGIAECTDASDENGCDTLARINIRFLTESTPSALKSVPLRLIKSTFRPVIARITHPPLPIIGPLKPVTCLSPHHFHCVHSNQCIPRSQLCDDHMDCEMMEDEHECVTVQCFDKEDHRLCNDKTTCLPVDLFCNGVQNCRDGSDELNCDYHDLPTSKDYLLPTFECPLNEFQCADGQCLDRKLVCNHQIDCNDGSDESGHCDECTDFGCSFGCVNSPKGPECICPPHTYLSSDFRTCEMANLCSLEKNKCNQFCRQSYDAVSCYCAPNYELINPFECAVNKSYETGSLFFTHGQNSVRRANLFNNTAFYEEYIPPMKIEHISSMSFNPQTHGLYLTVNLGHHETRVMLNNGEINKWFLSGHRIKCIAVDWITNNLYYAAESHVPSIGVCSPNGRFCAKIFEPAKTNLIHAYHFESLLFYPKRSQLIFLERHNRNPDGAVSVCDANGGYPRRLDHLDIGRKRAIALDYIMDHLFIAGEGIMHRIDLNTLRQHAVDAAVYPRAFLVFNGFFYFIEKETNALKRAKFGEEPVFLHQLQTHDASITINNSLYYPAMPNPCSTLGCSHICVLKHSREGSTPKGTCLCPSQYDLVDGQCAFKGHNHNSVVDLSGPRMAELCEVNNICENGGICNKTILDNGHTKLLCQCPVGFTGLYCEILVPLPQNTLLPNLIFAGLCFALTLFIVFTLAVLYLRYPMLRHRVSVGVTPTPSPKSMYSKRRIMIAASQDISQTPSTTGVNYFMNPVYEDSTTSPLIETTTLNHQVPRSPSEVCFITPIPDVTNPLFY